MKILNGEAILGDCLEEMKKIPDGSIDCIITDPPYGTTACKWDTVIPFEPMWSELKRIIKPNGAIVLFETVLDFTAGSFTTAVACENTNRKWICIEKDEGYYKIGTERVSSI